MAKTSAVWGIDIGNSSLKALRCQQGPQPNTIEAVACDFIEHSKVLSLPGTDIAETLGETLQTFLSRNTTKGDKVAISVSGQNTISRFLKLPPVDPKKIPDVIKYEAKQWLPFDLNDVILDFQPVGLRPAAEMLETEIGMFAMKRDIAFRTLNPYLENNIDVDCIQSSPIAMYNFITFDQLYAAAQGEYDPNNPPEFTILLSIGTDATDMVITNGHTIWIRNIAIGGNSFTRALAKGLKLTTSKAEYLKRNATAAQDAKAVFQAMRPVFNDMLTEIHRSIEHYQSLNRRARFSKIVALGNAMKMPGLRQFLTQNLGYEVVRLNGFTRLIGSEVLETQAFKENASSFGISYGLVLQMLGESALSTNLIPKEIVVDRIVREKKPWALAGAAAILLGLMCQYAGASRALKTVSSGEYKSAETQAKDVASYSTKMKGDTGAAVSAFKIIDDVGTNLTSNVEGRITWLEVLRAIDVAMPKETAELSAKEADEVSKQERVFIQSVEAITVDDLAAWFAPLKKHEKYYPDDFEIREAMEKKGSGAAAPPSGTAGADAGAATPSSVDIPSMLLSERLTYIDGPPTGTAGKVVQLVGYHYHNPDKMPNEAFGSGYLRKTLLYNLKIGDVTLPSTLEKQMRQNVQTARDKVTMKELGISFPTLLNVPKLAFTEVINPRVILEMIRQDRIKDLNRTPGATGATGAPRSSSFGGGTPLGGRPASSSPDFSSMTNPFGSPGGGIGGPGRTNTGKTGTGTQSIEERLEKIAKDIDAADKISLQRFEFVVQFAWVETPPSVREMKREEQKAAELGAESTPGPATPGPVTPPPEPPPIELQPETPEPPAPNVNEEE